MLLPPSLVISGGLRVTHPHQLIQLNAVALCEGTEVVLIINFNREYVIILTALFSLIDFDFNAACSELIKFETGKD
jgi:hypothetical protein